MYSNYPKPIPILVYHECPNSFEEQILYLKNQGFDFIHLFDVKDYLYSPKIVTYPTDKKVVLTFDDAFLDFYKNAKGILEKHGYKGKATLCVPVGFVSFEESNRRMWNYSPTMTWGELRELKTEGYEIIPHSIFHTNHDVFKDKPDILEIEIQGSKSVLQSQLEIEEFNFYCLPYGAGWGKKEINEILKSNNMGALRADYDPNKDITSYWDKYTIPRCEPKDRDDLEKILREKFLVT